MIDFKKLGLRDSLDLAILIEEEAQARYEQFVAQLGSRYPGDASDIFETMAANEAKHAVQLKARRRELFKDAPIQVSIDMIWDVEAPGPGRLRPYMSPRQAAELALESEIKAYHFFDEALKVVTDPEVRALFHELREEEVQHRTSLETLLSSMPRTSGPDLSDDDIDEPSAL